MPELRFDGTLSLGNILVVVTLIISMVAAWIANRERTFSNAAAIGHLVVEVGDLEKRVRSIEIQLGRKEPSQ